MRRPLLAVILLAGSAGCASLLGLEEVTPTNDASDGSAEGGVETGPLDVSTSDVAEGDASDAGDAAVERVDTCSREYFTTVVAATTEGATVVDNAVGQPAPSLQALGTQSNPSGLVLDPLNELSPACGPVMTCTFELRVTTIQTARSVVWIDGSSVFRIDVESGQIYARTSLPSSVNTLAPATADTFVSIGLSFPSAQQISLLVNGLPGPTMTASPGKIHLGSKPIPADSGTFPTYLDNVRCTRK